MHAYSNVNNNYPNAMESRSVWSALRSSIAWNERFARDATTYLATARSLHAREVAYR